MNRITKLDAVAEISRLIAAGYHVPDGGAEATAAVWVVALADVSLDAFRSATAEYIRAGGRYWPKPSDLRELVAAAHGGRTSDPSGHTLDRRYRAWENHSCDQNARDRECSQCVAGCPVCGAVRQVCHELSGMLGIRHDAGEHNRQRVRWVGLPYSSEATAMYEAARKTAPARGPAVPMRRPDADRQIDREAWTRRQREQLDALLKLAGIEGRAPDSQAAD